MAVGVLRPRGHTMMYQHIFAAVDSSPVAHHILRRAADLAVRTGAVLGAGDTTVCVTFGRKQ